MPAVKITNKPVSTPGDQTHFLVTQPELPEGYAPTGQETEEELAELKVESLREIEMDDMVELFQSKFAFDSEPTAESNKPVTSAGIKAALDSVDSKIGELKENLSDLQELADTKAPVIYGRASGAIASFSDGADDMPMKSAVVSLEPIQDLHGYDSPWPAGGGVNKLPPAVAGTSTNNGITVISNGDGTYNVSGSTGTASANVYFDLVNEYTIESDDYFHFGNSAANANIVFNLENTGGGNIWYGSVTPVNRVVDIGSKAGEKVGRIRVYVSANIENVNMTIKPMFCKASSAIDYSPYSNICPISGRTGAKVTRSGKNLVNPALSPYGNRRIAGITYENGDNEVTLTTIKNQDYVCLGLFYYFKSGTYTIKYSATSNDEYVPLITIYKSGGNTVKTWMKPDSSSTFTISTDGVYEFRLFASTIGNGVVGRVVRFYDMQVESGNTSTDYEPYKGTEFSVNWETEAGTVYGGTLDVVSGKLTVDWTSDDMGQYDWGGNNGIFNFTLHNTSPSWTRNSIDWMRSSAYKPESWNSIDYGTSSDCSIHGLVYGAVTVLRVYDSRYQTVADFKSGVSGTQFVYELATPIEIQLTPQEVSTLLGVNNVWSDGGDVEVEYPADTKTYIDTKIAEAVAAAMA